MLANVDVMWWEAEIHGEQATSHYLSRDAGRTDNQTFTLIACLAQPLCTFLFAPVFGVHVRVDVCAE